jgi:hypothetical protein
MTRKNRTARAGIPGRGRALAELRRSNAAGLHARRRPDRSGTRRRAIADSVRAG